MTINAYLTFAGNCREAMSFYHACLGGKLTFQTVGESPLSSEMPHQMKDCILHSTLQKDNLVLMATDMADAEGVKIGTNVSLVLNCNSEAEMRETYQKLAQNGRATHPIEQTFWGALLGSLTDKFGNKWLLSFQKQN